VYSFLSETRRTAEKRQLPYGITQYYRRIWTRPTLTPARQAGTRLTYHGGMKSGVDIGGVGYVSKLFTCPQTFTHLLDGDPTGSWTHDLSIVTPTL